VLSSEEINIWYCHAKIFLNISYLNSIILEHKLKMKRTIIYLLISLLFLGSTYQACCEACVSKLTVDTNMHSTDSTALPIVRTYTVSSKNAEDVDPKGFCGEVFEKHGTCCNQQDLKKRADAWSNRLKHRSEKIVKGFEKMDKLVDNIGKIKNWSNKHKDKITAPETRILNKDSSNNESTQNESSHNESSHNESTLGPKGKGKKKHKIEKPNSASLTTLEKHLENIEKGDKKKRSKREENAKKENNECHKELMKMRKSALCMRCSGVASDYFEIETGSYKVDEKVCSIIIEKCATVFAAIAEANSLYTNLAILKKAIGGAVSDDAESDVLEVEKLGKWQNCSDDKKACLGDMARVKELCAQVSLSSDNQALEGNLSTASEGIETGEAIETDGEPATSVATDFFSGKRLLTTKSQTKIHRILETADDGYGYAIASTTGANLITDFNSGTEIIKVLLSLGCLFAGIFLV